MIESSPKDQLQPKLHTHDYLKPGDQIALQSPIYSISRSRGRSRSIPPCSTNPWSNQLQHWAADGSEFRFVYNQRGHQIMRVIGIDASSGASRAIIEETSDTFIDYSQKHFVRFLTETDEILWSSERDGWHHLYLYDARRRGAEEPGHASGEWIVRSVENIDTGKRQITFRAMGIIPGQDPYHVHFARIDFDGSKLVHAQRGRWHPPARPVAIRPVLHRHLFARRPAPIHELRRNQTGISSANSNALISPSWKRSMAGAPHNASSQKVATARPTSTASSSDHRSSTRQETTPSSRRSTPVPHGHFVPKEFSAFFHAQSIAEHGFILVQIDGMGTNFRSKAFHDVCWRNLMDSGFPDRIAWLQAALQQHPEIDLARVGIFGGSAGGQSTLAGMLNYPDFYKVGVSDCGCHDNRMDKIWWNEAWMGWPIGEHYAANSNVTHAHKLRGKLLLTVGELDRNVDPASTMQVVDALIRCGSGLRHDRRPRRWPRHRRIPLHVPPPHPVFHRTPKVTKYGHQTAAKRADRAPDPGDSPVWWE